VSIHPKELFSGAKAGPPRYLYGYAYDDFVFPTVPVSKDSAGFTRIRGHDRVRRPVAVSLGPTTATAALPHPNPDPRTAAAGACKRFLAAPPVADGDLLDRLEAFVLRWLKKNIVPLAPGTDFDVWKWLESTKYPDWRKNELWDAWNECQDPMDKRFAKCKSFVKDEHYDKYKHCRGINSRTDIFKCLVGPIFKLIEQRLFKESKASKYFIKRIPVRDRAEYISKLYVPGATYIATDYQTFEALFTKDIMERVEFQLYSHVLQLTEVHDNFLGICNSVLAGYNECNYKWFSVFVEATRMSGEMCTSLGNGFSNLMFMLFMAEEAGCIDIDGVVEGDDGLFRMVGAVLKEEDFARLGLTITPEIKAHLNEASFCGLVYAEEDKNNVTDIIQEILSFGYTSGRYAGCKQGSRKLRSLLRAKSYSLAYQYPGCPVLSSLAKYGLRCTDGDTHFMSNINKDRTMSMWEREQLLEAVAKLPECCEVPIGIHTRLLVEDLYGISVETQKLWERYFDGLTTIVQIEPPNLDLFVTDVMVDYIIKYGHNEPEMDSSYWTVDEIPLPEICGRTEPRGLDIPQ